jgi:hypothetical protein
MIVMIYERNCIFRLHIIVIIIIIYVIVISIYDNTGRISTQCVTDRHKATYSTITFPAIECLIYAINTSLVNEVINILFEKCTKFAVEKRFP